jgi:hypothetical protein
MDPVLAIAVLSLILSALSLGWQAAIFFLEGGRVKASFRPGFSNAFAVMTVPPDKFTDSDTIAAMKGQGYAAPVVTVTVRNVGRLPVTIASWSVHAVPGGTAFQPMGQSVGPSFPHRLEAGESQLWALEFRAVYALLQATAEVLKHPDNRMRARATVELADGRTVKAQGLL